MSTIANIYGTHTAFSLVSNINSLASANAKPLGKVTNASDLALNYKMDIKVTLGGSGVSATGTLGVYLIESMDDTTWTDAIDPDGTSDIASSLKNAKLLAMLTANSNGQVVACVLDMNGFLGGLSGISDPSKFWTLVLLNSSGAALASSANAANYTTITKSVQ